MLINEELKDRIITEIIDLSSYENTTMGNIVGRIHSEYPFVSSIFIKNLVWHLVSKNTISFVENRYFKIN